jgi:hypothetical protein
MVGTVTLTAGADFGQTGQYIARLTGRAPRVQFERNFVGAKGGKRKELTSYETDEVGVYEVNNVTRKGRVREYWLVLPWKDELCLLRTDLEDSLAICKRLDAGEVLTDFVKIELGDPMHNRDGSPVLDEGEQPRHELVYSVLTSREAKKALAGALITSAVSSIIEVLAGFGPADQKKILSVMRESMANPQPTLEQAIKCGTADGAEAAEELFKEQGIDDLKKAQQAGVLDWDEPAINAGAAEVALKNSNLLDETRQAYYQAYNDAANRTANEIIHEQEDSK